MNIKNEKGIALIMSIGIVAMLAIIGTTFAINMRLEQKASANYLASIKAKTLAEAGIDQAIAILNLYAITQAYSDSYDSGWYLGDVGGGTIRTASSAGVITDLSKTWGTNALQNYRLKIIDRANWIYAIASNTANTITCSSANFTGISAGEGYAVMDPTLRGEVKIIDCARQIYVNNADVSEDTYDWNAGSPLRTMLNNLGTSLGTANTTIGNTIVGGWGASTATGYITKEQIKTVVGTDDYNIIKDYITTIGYVDTNMSPKRAPVNVNTASNMVLRAVLRSFLTDDTESNNLANDIINRRSTTGPFKTWKEFEDYIATLPVGIGGPATTSGTEAYNIIYNANPNKTKPATYTTEFCFHSGGNYEIISTGMVYDPAGNKAAEKKTKAITNIFNVWNQTTQAQFVANSIYGLDTQTTSGLLGILTTADSVYTNDFDPNMDNWRSEGGAERKTPSSPSIPKDGYAIELQPNEWTFAEVPRQLRLLFVSAFVYSTDQAGVSASIYLSDGINIGPNIRMNAATNAFEYYDTAWKTFGSGAATSEITAAWEQIDVVADVTGTSGTDTDSYNVYFFGSGTPARENTNASYRIPFQTNLNFLNRIVFQNLSASGTCYMDDVQIRCSGPMISQVLTTPISIKKWGTMSWTETTPATDNEIKIELSDDGVNWRGPNGSAEVGDVSFYSSNEFGLILNENGSTYFYVQPETNAIANSHNPSTPAIDSLYYQGTLAVTNGSATLPVFDDITITYLPVTRILYWRGLGEGE